MQIAILDKKRLPVFIAKQSAGCATAPEIAYANDVADDGG
jgi:hypothetical protein